MNLLAVSENPNEPWYISELGGDFPEYWGAVRAELQGDPVTIVNRAADLIKNLAEGLSQLHDNGVVHRDIKTENLTVGPDSGDEFPVLIDFGLVFRPDEPRVTEPDNAVGNVRFSPDVMMDRIAQVSPWLDVFQLAQLLIWLTYETPVKNWNRPPHWRWVKYDYRLPIELERRLRTVTDRCSSPETSPRSAKELLDLMNTLFPSQQAAEGEERTFDPSASLNAVAERKSEKDLLLLAHAEALVAEFETTKYYSDQITEGMLELHDRIGPLGLPISKGRNFDLELFKSLITVSADSDRADIFTLHLGSKGGFHVRFECRAFRPSKGRHIFDGMYLPNECRPIAFLIHRSG